MKLAHRDIKMENIMVDSSGTLKLIDMGHAGEIKDYDRHIGTTEYWAPEQHEKKKYHGELIDVFQMGIALFLAIFF